METLLSVLVNLQHIVFVCGHVVRKDQPGSVLVCVCVPYRYFKEGKTLRDEQLGRTKNTICTLSALSNKSLLAISWLANLLNVYSARLKKNVRSGF